MLHRFVRGEPAQLYFFSATFAKRVRGALQFAISNLRYTGSVGGLKSGFLPTHASRIATQCLYVKVLHKIVRTCMPYTRALRALRTYVG